MIITRTPFRISFFGGGTDYPKWYMKEGGQVLSATIDRYCYLTCRYLPPFFTNSFRIVWSHIEPVSTIREILHPAVREGLWMMGFDDSKGVEVHHQGDLPARSGMGSSSAFANGLLLGLCTLLGKSPSQRELYQMAIELEQKRLNENVGSQDQVATACGGLNHIRFSPGGQIDVAPLQIADERRQQLNRNLMLFFSGTSRVASDIAGDVIKALDQRANELRIMHRMVDEAVAILSSRAADLDDFGRLLGDAWQLKRRLSDRIATSKIDEVYQAACDAGALGGKLLGAGGAGFMLFYVPEAHQAKVRDALAKLLYVPFNFEREGAVVVSNTSDPAPLKRFSEIDQ